MLLKAKQDIDVSIPFSLQPSSLLRMYTIRRARINSEIYSVPAYQCWLFLPRPLIQQPWRILHSSLSSGSASGQTLHLTWRRVHTYIYLTSINLDQVRERPFVFKYFAELWIRGRTREKNTGEEHGRGWHFGSGK